MRTPWGNSDHNTTIARGLTSVSTAGHGGIMASKQFAAAYLTPEVCSHAIETSTHFAFEEDSCFAIAIHHLTMHHRDLLAQTEAGQHYLKEAIQKSMLEILSRWHPDYLRTCSVEPIPGLEACWLDNKREEEMRKNKHPDLVIWAMGTWSTFIPTCVEVGTADGKSHFVTEESYSQRSGLNLLSKVEPHPLPLLSIDQRLPAYLVDKMARLEAYGRDITIKDRVIAETVSDYAARLAQDIPGCNIPRTVVAQLLQVTRSAQGESFKELPCFQNNMSGIVDQLKAKYPDTVSVAPSGPTC